MDELLAPHTRPGPMTSAGARDGRPLAEERPPAAPTTVFNALLQRTEPV